MFFGTMASARQPQHQGRKVERGAKEWPGSQGGMLLLADLFTSCVLTCCMLRCVPVCLLVQCVLQFLVPSRTACEQALPSA